MKSRPMSVPEIYLGLLPADAIRLMTRYYDALKSEHGTLAADRVFYTAAPEITTAVGAGEAQIPYMQSPRTTDWAARMSQYKFENPDFNPDDQIANDFLNGASIIGEADNQASTLNYGSGNDPALFGSSRQKYDPNGPKNNATPLPMRPLHPVGSSQNPSSEAMLNFLWLQP